MEWINIEDYEQKLLCCIGRARHANDISKIKNQVKESGEYLRVCLEDFNSTASVLDSAMGSRIAELDNYSKKQGSKLKDFLAQPSWWE